MDSERGIVVLYCSGRRASGAHENEIKVSLRIEDDGL